MDLFCLLISLSSIVLSFSSAQGGETQTYIVRVQNDLKPSDYTDVEDWYSTTLRTLGSTKTETFQTETVQKKRDDFVYVYKTVFHGFSAKLTAEQALELSKREEILGVLPDRVHQVGTTRSTRFMGLGRRNPTGLMVESDSGSNVVIGIFDTGIWPERRSFHDEGLGPVPPHWRGECMEGERFKKEDCNKKVIGARYFTKGYEASMGRMNITTDIKSARDNEGHGTHTASTAAGRAVANASFFGFAAGVAVGIAPKARIAAYKICWKRGCLDSDILAALEKAVEDGVDIISLSIGGSGAAPYSMDPIAIGAFVAAERGIFVSVSAGNGGPSVRSVTSVAPWVTTVGAGTIDRKFPVDLLLADGTNITGESLYTWKPPSKKTYLPLVYAGNISHRIRSDDNKMVRFSFAGACMPGSLDQDLVRGKIVLCDRGGIPRVAKGQTVKDAGGVGVVVENTFPMGEGLIADSHLIPGLAITESGGNKLRAYISSSKDPRATMVFHGTHVGVKPAPVVASFSSRGPNPQSVYVLKPDVIAPGVNILAAWPDDVAPSGLSSDVRRTEFNMASGTSMSCPHLSGVAALLKGAHPDWSPAMIHSALMTTAYIHDREGNPLLDEVDYSVSNVWGTGAGHVDPERALNPGLVYDMTVNDYVNFLCASAYQPEDIKRITHKSVTCNETKLEPWNVNYPAISFGFQMSSNTSRYEIIVTRTVTHVADSVATYIASINPPKGSKVSVDPMQLDFKGKGEKQSYVVKIIADTQPPDRKNTETGKLTWTDGKHRVTSPIVILYQGVA